MVRQGADRDSIPPPMVDIDASPEDAAPAPLWGDADYECKSVSSYDGVMTRAKVNEVMSYRPFPQETPLSDQ